MNLIELAEESGLDPKLVASTNGGEYHSACPSCGGTDRFIIQPHKKMKNCTGCYWCRQCGMKGDSIQFCRDILGLDFHSASERVNATLSEDFRLKQILSSLNLRGTKMHHPEMLKPPSQTWQDKAVSVVESAHRCLLEQPEILRNLEKRGLTIEAIKKYKLGWIPKDTWHPGCEWNLDKDKVWIPKGIVIPTRQKDIVVRIKIRRHDFCENDELPKYVAVSGSMNGLNIIGNTKKFVMVVVESELDAYALHFAVEDLAMVVAIGSNIKNPDNVTHYLAKQVQHLLICHDNDDAGKKMLEKWTQLYSYAKDYPTPIGKDIGEAVQSGLDLRAWLNKVLPQKEVSIPPLITIDNKPIAKTEAPNQQIRVDESASTILTCIQKPKWSADDQALIDWFLNERNLPLTPFTLSTKEHGIEEVNDPESYYIVLRAAITGGPNTWEARTKRLQEILYLIKDLMEQNLNKSEMEWQKIQKI